MERKLLFLMSILLCTSFLYAQEKENTTYRIINHSDIKDIQNYKKAIEAANWKCYRMLNKSRIIKFDTGIEVELFSALALAANGISVSRDCLVTEELVNGRKYQPIYRLDPSGRIIELHESVGNTKQIK